jgi:hypothetical protein
MPKKKSNTKKPREKDNEQKAGPQGLSGRGHGRGSSGQHVMPDVSHDRVHPQAELYESR